MSQPILVVDSYGVKRWYLNEVLHREDGPAVEYPNGQSCWFLNGQYHREDGPAFIDIRKNKKEWWLHHENVSWKEVFKNANGNSDNQIKILMHVFE